MKRAFGVKDQLTPTIKHAKTTLEYKVSTTLLMCLLYFILYGGTARQSAVGPFSVMGTCFLSVIVPSNGETAYATIGPQHSTVFHPPNF